MVCYKHCVCTTPRYVRSGGSLLGGPRQPQTSTDGGVGQWASQVLVTVRQGTLSLAACRCDKATSVVLTPSHTDERPGATPHGTHTVRICKLCLAARATAGDHQLAGLIPMVVPLGRHTHPLPSQALDHQHLEHTCVLTWVPAASPIPARPTPPKHLRSAPLLAPRAPTATLFLCASFIASVVRREHSCAGTCSNACDAATHENYT